MKNPNIDYVMNYKELGAWFIALGVQLNEYGEIEFNTEASAEARNYAVTGGVAQAVQKLLPEHIPAYPYVVNGLDKNTIRDLKKFAKNGVCELGNLIEVMSCQGGCLGGNGTVNPYKQALKQLSGYVSESKPEEEIINLD